MRSFSSNLKQLRKGKGMSQEDLAQKLNVTRQTVSGWETERCQPDIDTLMALANALDADIQELIYGTKPGQYLRYQRKYVVWSAVCGGISVLFALFWVFLFPSLQTWLVENYLGYGLYFVCFCLPSIGCFAFGLFLPAAMRLYLPIQIDRRWMRICLSVGSTFGALAAVMLIGIVGCGRNAIAQALLHIFVHPAGRLLIMCLFPFLSGVLIFLGKDVNGCAPTAAGV